MPYERNHYFVGRDHDLEKVRNDFPLAVKDHHRIVIYGLGGVGKTQFAVEYHYRYRNFYEKQFWVNATDRPNLISGLCDIGERLRIGERQNIAGDRLAQLTLVHLAKGLERWLLVIDNLDNPEVLRNISLKGTETGHILITSRNPDLWAIPAQTFELHILDVSDAVKLLVDRLRDGSVSYNDNVAKEIVKELGYLPLAIEQAAGYIRASIGGLKEFRSHYRINRIAFLRRQGRADYPDSVATTWLMAIQNLEKEAPVALQLLYLLAFLNPDEVLIDFLLRGQDREEWMKSILTLEGLQMAVDRLRRYSLIQYFHQRNTICVHRLVQEVIKDIMGPKCQTLWRARALILCEISFPMPRQKEISANRLFRNQVMHCLGDPDLNQNPIVADLISRMAWYLDCEGEYQDAYKFWKRALEMYRELTKATGKMVYITMDRLANTEMRLGHNNEAVRILSIAFESLRRYGGEEDEDTLACQRNLAVALGKSGKREEGLSLLVKVYETQRHCMGEDSPRTQSTMVKLARAYQEEGRLNEARELLRRVCDKTQCEKSGIYQNALRELGWIQCCMKNVDEGLAFLQDAQKMQATALGQDNPTTLKTSSYLGYAYTLKNHIEKGKSLLATTIKKQEEMLGATHTDTRKSIHLMEKLRKVDDI